MRNLNESTLSKAQHEAAIIEREILKARTVMIERFAKPNWQFAVGTPDDREQRNSRAPE